MQNVTQVKDSVVVEFENSLMVLNFTSFKGEVDAEDIVRVDPTNLLGEMLTLPALMLRVGLWKAKSEQNERSSKIQYEVAKGQKADDYRRILSTPGAGGQMKYPAQASIEAKLDSDPDLIALLRRYNQKVYETQILDAFYWALRSKEKQVEALSRRTNLIPEDHLDEIVGKTFNGVFMQKKERLIQSK